MAKVSVIGAGSWGTALAVLLCNNGHHVTLWSYRKDQVEEMKREHYNHSKLPRVKLPETMEFTENIEVAVKGADLLVFAVPSTATEKTAHMVSPFVTSNQRIVCVSKGIQEETLLTQCEQIEQVLPQVSVSVLS